MPFLSGGLISANMDFDLHPQTARFGSALQTLLAQTSPICYCLLSLLSCRIWQRCHYSQLPRHFRPKWTSNLKLWSLQKLHIRVPTQNPQAPCLSFSAKSNIYQDRDRNPSHCFNWPQLPCVNVHFAIKIISADVHKIFQARNIIIHKILTEEFDGKVFRESFQSHSISPSHPTTNYRSPFERHRQKISIWYMNRHFAAADKENDTR